MFKNDDKKFFLNTGAAHKKLIKDGKSHDEAEKIAIKTILIIKNE